jgi:hypothetical protein
LRDRHRERCRERGIERDAKERKAYREMLKKLKHIERDANESEA